MAGHLGRPVQARYLMTQSEDTIAQKVSVFTFRLKNWVRLLGVLQFARSLAPDWQWYGVSLERSCKG